MDLFCYLCFFVVFVKLSCLLVAALWSPAGKGFSCVFVPFPYSVLGQVWYLFLIFAFFLTFNISAPYTLFSEIYFQVNKSYLGLDFKGEP